MGTIKDNDLNGIDYQKELAFFERMVVLLKMEMKLNEDGEETGKFRDFRMGMIDDYLNGEYQ